MPTLYRFGNVISAQKVRIALAEKRRLEQLGLDSLWTERPAVAVRDEVLRWGLGGFGRLKAALAEKAEET